MRKPILGLAVIVAVGCLARPVLADYYATKADERAGRLTPGPAPNTPGKLAPLAGTDTCPGTPIPAGAADFTDTGTTIGATSTVDTLQPGCSDYIQVFGPDVVYTFDLGPVGARAATLAITVTPTGGTGYDTAIYTLSTAGTGCPSGTGSTVTNCVNGADAATGNGAETISDAETDAMAAGTYFLFVDSFYTSAPKTAGSYNLTMNRPLPVELLDFEIK